MTTISESVRSILIDSDKRELSIILREFPTVLLTATNLSFGDPEFRFSLIYSGSSEADCQRASDFLQSKSLDIGNLIHSVALPVFVGSENKLKTLLDVSGSAPQE